MDPKACWFLPLESTKAPDLLGIRIGCPTFEPSVEADFTSAAYVVLDTILGELRAAEDVAHLEIASLPATPEDAGFIELVDLPRYLEWRRDRRRSSRPS
jgi:hypothetical protein